MRSQFGQVSGSVLLVLALAMPCVSQSPSVPCLSQVLASKRSSPNPIVSGARNRVLYTGQLDGLLGSKSICRGLSASDCDAKIKKAVERIQEYKTTSHGILVGMGDNFGPFGFDPQSGAASRYIPQTMLGERLTLTYSNNPLVEFVADSYDAVVPGREDFTWGVEYLRCMTDENYLRAAGVQSAPVPLIANNLVLQAKPDPVCRSYPSPAPALPLLPNQVAAPISASGTSGASGGTGSGGSGGGGKGKGKGGKGGGGAAGGGGAGGGGAGGATAAGGAGACPQAGAAGAAGTAGATTSGSIGNTILSRKQAEAINLLPRPSLVYPDSSAIYPWTFSIALSAPNAEAGKKFDTDFALVCPAEDDPSKVDQINVAECVKWYYSPTKLVPVTFGEIEEKFSETVRKALELLQLPLPTQTVQFTLIKQNAAVRRLVPVREDGFIFTSGSEIALDIAGQTNPQPSEGKVERPTGILFPGNSVRVCLLLSPANTTRVVTTAPTTEVEPPTDGTYRCTASSISVQRPVFRRAWIRAHSDQPGGYVIFGALASDTLNGLSDVNKELAPLKVSAPVPAHPTMQVNATDPASAINQAVTAFNELHPNEQSIAIVLAQMTAGEAKSLSDSLGSTPFDKNRTEINMIMAEADPVETSPEATVTIPGPTENDPQRFIPVISPSPIFQRADCLKHALENGDCIATADITLDNGSMKLSNTPARITSGQPIVAQQTVALSPSNTFCDNEGTKLTWECWVLMVMRDAFHDEHTISPEVAILEARDFDYIRSDIKPDLDLYSPHGMPLPSTKQEIEALWNAGNMTRVTLLGSTLTAILNQNRSNQSQTYQTIASVQQSQQLRVLGIFQVGQTYYINGIPLDSTKLYSVVTSDNLATTTSDYGSLASIDQNPPEVFWDHKQTFNIADIVYTLDEDLAPLAFTQAALEAPYRDTIDLRDRQQAAPQLTPLALSITHSVRTLFPAPAASSSLSSIGRQAELGPLFHIAVQQLSFGYSDTHASQQDQLIGTNLGGVTNPNVLSPHSDMLSSAASARLEYYFRRNVCGFCLSDVGVDGQFNLTHSIQGSLTAATPIMTTSGETVPASARAYPANAYFTSPFIEFQTSSAGFWKPVVLRPVFVSGNVISAKQFLASANPKLNINPNLDFNLSQKHSVALGEGIGTRLEYSDFTYLEVGFAYQRSYHVLSDVSVAGQTPCPLNSSTSLNMCASNFIATPGINLMPSYGTFNQKGGYMLGTLTQEFPRNPFKNGYPVWRNKPLFLYQGTAFGNFFAYGRATDSSTLTHYAFSLNNTLQVQLPANFSLGPSYNVFWFKANEHGVGSSLVRSSLSVQLSYSFDWHSGMSFRNSLIGKTQ